MTCPRCSGHLGRQWCIETKTEYDYCLNCGHRLNQSMYYQHNSNRDNIVRRCLDCNRKCKEVYELKTGETKVYTRCYYCRRKASFTRHRRKAVA